jgi:uncharacterized membrane protein
MRNTIHSTREEFRTERAEMTRRPPRNYMKTEESSSTERQLTQTVGWFSLGLGITALLAPRRLSNFIGVTRNHQTLVRIMGLREIASGAGILTQKKPSAWFWSRVAGDVLDLSLLGVALSSDDSDRKRLTAALTAVAGVTLLDLQSARQLGRNGNHYAERVESITINRPLEEVYRFWRDFQNLPQFMSHLKSVQVSDATYSHWIARGPAGTSVEWDAEITRDQPNEVIAWRSLENAQVENAGEVRFKAAPAGRGTEVHVRISYAPPGGSVGVAIAKLFGEEPGQQLKGDLYRFKQVMETGEVLHSDASIHRGRHPAQPPRQSKEPLNRPPVRSIERKETI